MVGRRAVVAIGARATIAATATVTTAIVAGATTVAAIATVRTITARFARLARFTRRAGVFQLGTGFLVNHAHRQADFAARVDFEHLDLDFLAFLDDVARLFHALVAHFRDVDEAVLAAHEVHKGAEINDVDDFAVVDFAHFGFFDNAEDPLAGSFDLGQVGRADLDQAFVVDCRRCR